VKGYHQVEKKEGGQSLQVKGPPSSEKGVDHHRAGQEQKQVESPEIGAAVVVSQEGQPQKMDH